MSTEFSFENIFTAPSVDAVLAAYFDADHLAVQDKVAGLTDRVLVEDTDDGATKLGTWTVRASTQLPLFVRPFVEGGRLSYVEKMVWRKAANEIDMTITPQILGGRVQITAVYTLSSAGEGQVKRRYKGTISVNLRLISGKAERGILEEITKGMPKMYQCTQDWLTKKYG